MRLLPENFSLLRFRSTDKKQDPEIGECESHRDLNLIVLSHRTLRAELLPEELTFRLLPSFFSSQTECNKLCVSVCSLLLLSRVFLPSKSYSSGPSSGQHLFLPSTYFRLGYLFSAEFFFQNENRSFRWFKIFCSVHKYLAYFNSSCTSKLLFIGKSVV